MQRLGSAFSLRVRLLFALAFFIVWRVDDLLVDFIVGTRFWAALPLSSIGPSITQGLATIHNLLVDGFSDLGIAIAGAFNALPAAVRDVIPTNALSRLALRLVSFFSWDAIGSFGAILLRLAGLALRFLVTLNIAGCIYNLSRIAKRYITMALMLPVRFYSERESEEESSAAPNNGSLKLIGMQRAGQTRRREYVEFFNSHIQRIGIILPGGGARSVYQAGALKAIYDFLGQYNALDKVKMITATSTGAWNAMFWLTGLMEEPKPGGPSIENWWKQTQFSDLVDFPWFWIPGISSFHYRPGPWREQFKQLFRDRIDPIFAPSPKIHLYFTRTDIRLSALGYSTNWSGVKQVVEKLGVDKQDNYRFIDVIENDGEQLQRLTDAIFASLGQAPLLPGKIQGAFFEDGDVLDPVPMRFAVPIESCDLVFVLPSNGPLEIDGNSREQRMRRIAHLQRAALERVSLKNADTINRMVERFERLQFGADTIASSENVFGLAEDAIHGIKEEIEEFGRAYKRLYVFTATPTGNMKIASTGYGQSDYSAAAFDLMYKQTSDELQHRFFEDIEPEDSQMVMVDGVQTGDAGNPARPSYRRTAHL